MSNWRRLAFALGMVALAGVAGWVWYRQLPRTEISASRPTPDLVVRADTTPVDAYGIRVFLTDAKSVRVSGRAYLRVEVTLLNDREEVPYHGWNRPKNNRLPRLYDDQERECRRADFGPGVEAEGRRGRTVLKTRWPVSDHLYFDPPARDAKVLYLELPNDHLQGTGTIRLRLDVGNE